MEHAARTERGAARQAPLAMDPGEFRALGHRLIDRIAEFLESLPRRPVTPGKPPKLVRELLGGGALPECGADPRQLLEEAAQLLFENSLFNSHPRFWGWITAPPAPIGILGELLAAAVNPNCGGWILAPMATEIEAQTVRWIAELIGYPGDCGGLLVSGGNMANLVGFFAARKAMLVRRGCAPERSVGRGVASDAGQPGDGAGDRIDAAGTGRLRAYVSTETHTWIQKAAELSGLGADSIRWIPADEHLRLDTRALRKQIEGDLDAGDFPFLAVGAAGTVSTGAIDPLPEIAAICREHGLWFHVDGAYGAPAAVLPDASAELRGLSQADSVAVDPHKWLYAPLEAGCVLVRNREALREAFAFRPPYYHFHEAAEEGLNYFEYGPQNSRGFRALKVWLALRQVGREGYVRMISDDIQLARSLHQLVTEHPELEAFSGGLSITTFRYVPSDLKPGAEDVERYLNQLNTELLSRLQQCGEAFVSNAVAGGAFVLRACIVNFRTSLEDVRALPEIVVRIGRELDRDLRPAELQSL